MYPSPRTRPGAIDVASVGEVMAMFVPESAAAPTERSKYLISAAGAEANVVRNLARLGASSAWLGRIGADPFGDFVVEVLARDGVDVSGVERDLIRPTGVAFKEPRDSHTRVHYYRTESAASALGPSFAPAAWALKPRILHLSGITPALSEQCLAFIEAALSLRPHGSLVSFDVNWRAKLWTESDPDVLLSIAQDADIAFVGLDEAEDLWGVTGVNDVRAMIDRPATLIVKLGAAGCAVFSANRRIDIPALKVDVVEPVGAGDAFAAGFLLGRLKDHDDRTAARLGTIVASSALTINTDVGVAPAAAYIDSLLVLSDDEWAQVQYSPPSQTRTREHVPDC